MRQLFYGRNTDEIIERRLNSSLEKWVREGKHRNPDQPMEHVAKEMDVTKEELSFHFTHRIGKKFYAWRKQLRIEDAKVLLEKREDLSITQIGHLIGINDVSDFRRQFYEITGCYPQQWRNAARNCNIKEEK